MPPIEGGFPSLDPPDNSPQMEQTFDEMIHLTRREFFARPDRMSDHPAFRTACARVGPKLTLPPLEQCERTSGAIPNL